MKKKVFLYFLICMYNSVNAQSSQLNYYIDHALQNSPLIKDIRNQIILNKYDSLLIRAAAKPQVTSSSFNSYAPVIEGYGYDGAITNGGNFNALIGVNKQIQNKINIAAQFENLQIQSLSLNNTSKINEKDLKRTIVAQYITAFGSLLQLDFNKEISLLLSKEEIILKKLTQNNIYKQSDYLTFLVTEQQQSLVIKQLSIQYKNELASLNYLSGLADTSAIILLNPDINFNLLPSISISPLFKQFEIDSLKLTNNKKLIDINYKPKVNLFADGGFNSSLAYTPYKNFGTSFGASITLPIYDGKQKKIQYSKIEIAEKTRNNYKSFFITQYQQQIAQLTQQLNTTEELITDINNQLKYTQSLIDVNEKLLEAGEARITDYILALNNYINAKNLITQNNINRLQIINQLNYWNR